MTLSSCRKYAGAFEGQRPSFRRAPGAAQTCAGARTPLFEGAA